MKGIRQASPASSLNLYTPTSGIGGGTICAINLPKEAIDDSEKGKPIFPKVAEADNLGPEDSRQSHRKHGTSRGETVAGRSSGLCAAHASFLTE
ncbi:hypothetical protein U0070_013904, partial [Myodes glareolus]